jgi:hypothetical protein
MHCKIIIGSRLLCQKLAFSHEKIWVESFECKKSTSMVTRSIMYLVLLFFNFRKEHGVWDYDTDGKPKLLKNHYFSVLSSGTKVEFREDFYLPFLKRFAIAMKEANSDLLFFFEPIPNEDPPKLDLAENWHNNSVYAPHWYDLDSVFYKKFTGLMTHDVQALSKGTQNVLQASYFGISGAKRNYSKQVSNVVKNGLALCGVKPCLIGECGIPMDINEKKVSAF